MLKILFIIICFTALNGNAIKFSCFNCSQERLFESIENGRQLLEKAGQTWDKMQAVGAQLNGVVEQGFQVSRAVAQLVDPNFAKEIEKAHGKLAAQRESAGKIINGINWARRNLEGYTRFVETFLKVIKDEDIKGFVTTFLSEMLLHAQLDTFSTVGVDPKSRQLYVTFEPNQIHVVTFGNWGKFSEKSVKKEERYVQTESEDVAKEWLKRFAILSVDGIDPVEHQLIDSLVSTCMSAGYTMVDQYGEPGVIYIFAQEPRGAIDPSDALFTFRIPGIYQEEVASNV